MSLNYNKNYHLSDIKLKFSITKITSKPDKVFSKYGQKFRIFKNAITSLAI